ncbi:MAG: hypothetical protein RMJ07_02820 [Nitrososphaerota archaeon]|nr:hypothetical protein [Candidatus Bathyarchaeota archaeon]MDW8048598.1 hypothetical protein [Nitrososphaerota archaeon]
MKNKKVEIIYFYSDVYESGGKLSRLIKKLQQQRGDIQIHLINVDDPKNENLTELYSVNTVPLMIFLTPEGQIAARRFMPLSSENVVNEIADQVVKGILPNPAVDEKREKIVKLIKNITKRGVLTELIADEIINDILEANLEAELDRVIDSHISILNHTIKDLEEIKTVLNRYSKRRNEFLI